MKFPRRQFLHLAAGAAALPAVSRVARAQAYPTRPVRLIAPFPAGGVVDLFSRLIAQPLSERLGQTVIVENRVGAGGNVGTESAVRASPDGYTLLLMTSTNAINQTLYDKLNFDIIDKLHREINACLDDPKLQARIVELGYLLFTSSRAEFTQFVAESTEKWGEVIRAANIKAE